MSELVISACLAGAIFLGGVIFLLISLITYLRPQIYCRRYSVEFLSWALILLGMIFLLRNIGYAGIIDYSMLITGPAGGVYILHLLAKKPNFYEKHRLVILLGIGFIVPWVASMSIDLSNSIDYVCPTTPILELLIIGNSIVQGFILIGLAFWLRSKFYTKRLHNGIYEGCSCPHCSSKEETTI